MELAHAWASRFEVSESENRAAQMTPLCTTFLAKLGVALFRTRLLQEYSLVRDLLTLDANDRLTETVSTVVDYTTGIEANMLAIQKEITALREAAQSATRQVDKAFAT